MAEEKAYWEGKHFAFFTNKECEYYPCHPVKEATTVICMASTLHTVATGNMTPCYRLVDGVVRPVYFYSVDVSEFAVNKLRDRGSLSVRTIVTNVQDFVVNVRKGVL